MKKAVGNSYGFCERKLLGSLSAVETAVECAYASSGVYTLVLTCVERMAGGTYFDFEVLFG
jgi:hypothetical protein